MIVTSQLFGDFPGVTFGMSTRAGGVSPEPFGMNLSFHVGDDEPNVVQNRALLFERLGVPPEQAVFAGQIHSATVRIVDSAGTYPDCDGLVTNKAGRYCCISIADCIPIFLFDPGARVIAAVHAGWRGTAAGIVSHAVLAMKEEFQSKPADIYAFIGPGAGPCCYEVGEEVATRFPEKFRRAKENKQTIDLKGVNAGQLLEAGLEEARIEKSAECTICATQFHSFRRDGARSGRMMGIIGMC